MARRAQAPIHHLLGNFGASTRQTCVKHLSLLEKIFFQGYGMARKQTAQPPRMVPNGTGCPRDVTGGLIRGSCGFEKTQSAPAQHTKFKAW
jgi:hypothetical protein